MGVMAFGLVGWLAGIVLQLQQSTLWSCSNYLALWGWAFAGGVLLWSHPVSWEAGPYLRSLWRLLAFVCFAIVAFSGTGLRSLYFQHSALDPALEGRDVMVTGVVSDLPQRNANGLRMRMAVESARLGDQEVTVPSIIDLGWYSTSAFPLGERVEDGFELQRVPVQVQAGERWRMLVRLKVPHGGRNPLGFDYELWLWDQGVQATGYVRAGKADPVPQRLGQTWHNPVDLARQMVRQRIDAHVESSADAGLISALVMGDQRAIDRAQWDVFRATGVAHLVSISGVHITMFAWAAQALLGWWWRRSQRLCLWLPASTVGLWGGVGLALFYSAFSGWGVPAQRTCIMLLTVATLRWSGVRWPWPLVWLLACAVVTALDPWALLQAGFWLSFVAVGVLLVSDRKDATTVNAPGWRARWQRWGAALQSGAREQWLITLALAPLTLLWFGQLSVVGLVANAFAIPWVTLVITPLSMLGVALPALWSLAVWCVEVLLWGLQMLATLSWATYAVAMPPWWLGALGTVAGVLLVAPLPWAMRAMGGVLMLPLLMWRSPSPMAGEFSLLAADVGQGNAVIVRTAHHALLYDAGPRYSLESDAGHRVLVPLLQALQIRLDRVVLSHRDTDHVGGAVAVLQMQPQADLFSSIEDDHALQSLRPATRCEAGQAWDWDGVHFSVLHPQMQDYAAPRKPNAMSCVLRIDNGRQSALLVGDIEREQEAALVAREGGLRSTVLLVPHHGSKTSSTSAFLDAVQPQWALVQSGYRNRFGHPAPTVLARYQERHIMVRDSPHCGAAMWESGAPGEVMCTRMEQLRYWHHRVP